MEKRDKDLLQKLQFSNEAFYNNQVSRDNQLLGILKERDAKQEEQTKENINGFKFLYMSLVKDFETKMEGRDKVLDENDAFRRKVWLENLDLINNNLSKFLEVMTEMEKNMNTLGMRQDELNKKVDLTNELAQEKQTDKEKAKGKRRIEVKIPEFSPTLDTLDLDPPNIYTRKQKIKKIDRSIQLLIPPYSLYCYSQPLQQNQKFVLYCLSTICVFTCIFTDRRITIELTPE